MGVFVCGDVCVYPGDSCVCDFEDGCVCVSVKMAVCVCP